MTIDAHHHFWHYDPAKYEWIGNGMDVLKQDFMPEQLAAEIEGIVDGVITVQACQSVDETQWLLDVARDTPYVLGVVGWVPLAADDVGEHLAGLAANASLTGIRHVLQDEPDDAYVLRDDFNRGVGLLESYGLTYDILILDHHLPNAIRFVDRHPYQTFVLDHLAKPRIRDEARERWEVDIRNMAERANCYCKVSGIVTEARWESWTADDLYPYFDTVFEAFGTDRLMFGSDWPVCLLASDYHRWYHTVDEYIAGFSEDERERILGGTAIEAYRLVV